MKQNNLIAVVAIILLGVGVAAYLYWQYVQPQVEPMQVDIPNRSIIAVRTEIRWYNR